METKTIQTEQTTPSAEDIEQQNISEVNRVVQKGSNGQLIVFKLRTEEYAINIGQVKEVVKTPDIAAIPETPKYIKGVANIRGNIIAIIDLADRFGLNKNDIENKDQSEDKSKKEEPARHSHSQSQAGGPEQEKDASDHADEKKEEKEKIEEVTNGNDAKTNKASYSLVIEGGGYTIGILLEEVPDTLAVTSEDIDETPAIFQNKSIDSNYIKGIVKKEERLIILIDIHQIMKMDMIGEKFLEKQE